MSLLVAEDLTQRGARGTRSFLALHHVTLTIDAGEFVAVRGLEPHGRRALTLVLGGLLRPDHGAVRLGGLDLYEHRRRLVPSAVAVCWNRFEPGNATQMLEHVALPARLRGATRAEAATAARQALDRVGAAHVRALHPYDVEPHDLVRAGIARAIVLRPRMLLLNDLTSHIGIHRDPVVELMRSLSVEDAMAVVLMAAHLVPGPDRALEIHSGTLRGKPHPGPTQSNVTPLRRAEQ